MRVEQRDGSYKSWLCTLVRSASAFVEGFTKTWLSMSTIIRLPTSSHHFPQEPASSIDHSNLNGSSPLLHLKVGLLKPGLDLLLGNPHTPSSLDIDKALEITIYIF